MKDIFCAKCQAVTPHTGTVDGNGEFLFTCTTEECGRFIKFPADITKDEFEAKLADHHEDNIGQVSLEGQEVKLYQLLDAAPPELPTEEVESEVTQPEEPTTQEQTPTV